MMLKTLVIHDATGRILQTYVGDPAHLPDDALTLEVDQFRHDWDKTHRVLIAEDGSKTLAERDPAELAAEALAPAWAALRRKRDALLQYYVDGFNPLRLAELTDEDRAALTTYRQALLDLPANTTDPTQPTWPALVIGGRSLTDEAAA